MRTSYKRRARTTFVGVRFPKSQRVLLEELAAAEGLTLLNLVRTPAGWRIVHDASM